MSEDLNSPKAFISHASEDKPLARKLANDLNNQGVQVFFDEWDIGLGDSIRQRIDAGLQASEWVLILFSEKSLQKPWVNAESDAAFTRKMAGQAKVIPVRIGLRPDQLPPLFQTLRSPSLDDYDAALTEIVSSLHGIARRPPLGPAPAPVRAHPTGAAGLSPAATQIAKLMIDGSNTGGHGDPGLEPDELRQKTGLSDDDIVDAVDELKQRSMIYADSALGGGPIGFIRIRARPELFVALDRHFTENDPAQDALRIAADLVNGASGVVSDMSQKYGWAPRRLNPALAVLIRGDYVSWSRSLDPTFVTHWIDATPATRRFVRDKS